MLKQQLTGYRKIIGQRLKQDQQVVTFQDNTKLMPTSLRHLRLSKLQKEKSKQGKLWDFTVRGSWVADTTGLEEFFESRETAAEPQQSISSFEYKDVLIGTLCFMLLSSCLVLQTVKLHNL